MLVTQKFDTIFNMLLRNSALGLGVRVYERTTQKKAGAPLFLTTVDQNGRSKAVLLRIHNPFVPGCLC